MPEKIFEALHNITAVPTAHLEGKKFVFLSNEDTATMLTQFAYGSFEPGEKCSEHVHSTMEECFFFIKGTGRYVVGGIKYDLVPGSFLRIPAGVPHNLEATGTGKLEFVYFGIATK